MSKFLFHPRRVLGRTGFVATALGIGDLADRHAGPRLLHTTTVGEPLTPRYSLSRGKGRPLSWAPSAHAVAGRGRR